MRSKLLPVLNAAVLVRRAPRSRQADRPDRDGRYEPGAPYHTGPGSLARVVMTATRALFVHGLVAAGSSAPAASRAAGSVAWRRASPAGCEVRANQRETISRAMGATQRAKAARPSSRHSAWRCGTAIIAVRLITRVGVWGGYSSFRYRLVSAHGAVKRSRQSALLTVGLTCVGITTVACERR